MNHSILTLKTDINAVTSFLSDRLLVWVFVALVTPLVAGAPAIYAQEPLCQPGTDITIKNETFKLEVIRLVNQKRTSRCLHSLRHNGSLTKAARAQKSTGGRQGGPEDSTTASSGRRVPSAVKAGNRSPVTGSYTPIK